MKVEIEIPEPDFKLAPNEIMECRGLGWSAGQEVKYTLFDTEYRVWTYPVTGTPDSRHDILYFEIVEDFPMPPEELDGFKLEYVKSEERKLILEGKIYAVFVEGRWVLSFYPYEHSDQIANLPCALATPIEKKTQEVISDMENSIAGLQSELKELKKRVG